VIQKLGIRQGGDSEFDLGEADDEAAQPEKVV
jgi:hypothetical protein